MPPPGQEDLATMPPASNDDGRFLAPTGNKPPSPESAPSGGLSSLCVPPT
eukprot:CAMPEP_0180245404 /NCGR_PEP_ID=MMETSP0987-20121128/34986_1 /TAXON_ID=697907 /ORGANISM="non described non described, Strain CCMP2293" /LENGTH=49 /DNA_ID=CAMNT_0022213077 /DNA_START=210 /DNA_END=359 /DNA_ORIENTATION=+